jgi:hypothetical protein
MRVLATFLTLFLATTYAAPLPVQTTLTTHGHLPKSKIHYHSIPETTHHDLEDEHVEHKDTDHSGVKGVHHPHIVSDVLTRYRL